MPRDNDLTAKSGIKQLDMVLVDNIKKIGCNITNKIAVKPNLLLKVIILSKPKNLSKNLAVSPKNIRNERKKKPIKPANLPAR